MFSSTVNYTDFDDQPQTRTLWFHISQSDILDNLDIKEQFEEVLKSFEGERRALTEAEVRKILALIKRFARISYGERSADGTRFKKNDEVWENFYETNAYDQFIQDLFSPDPTKAFEFMLAAMPKDLRDRAEAQARQENPEIFAAAEQTVELKAEGQIITIKPEDIQPSLDTRPAWERENREPTQVEIRNATPEQLRALWIKKAGQ